MKFGSIVFILSVLISANAAALNVSLMLVETGPGAGDIKTASEWESGMFDVFFDNGMIVSNARRISTDSPPERLPPEVNSAITDAMDGHFDYFVEISLNFPIQNRRDSPGSVTMQLFDIGISPPVLVYSDVYNWIYTLTPRTAYNNARRAAQVLISHLGD
jgi:hypothetical protein